MSGQLWYLKACRLFESCTTEQLQRLEANSRVKNVSKGSPVYLPADEADSVLVLASGRIKICHLTSDGKQSILAFIEPGEIFGELAILNVGNRDEYAEAVEDSRVVAISGEALCQLMEEHQGLCLGITKIIGVRRQRIERRVKHLLYLSNRERICHLLLELAEQYGRDSARGLEITLRLSHQDLASLVGSTRETVTVVLGQLQNEGLIELGRRKVILKAPDRLAHQVGVPPIQTNTTNLQQQPSSRVYLRHSFGS
ncbi:Crp/Fnr family transcriptional regulator [Blastopirellula marina]|uniref:Crp/Fnr family transcriptional regulator n=1 Tax=Blastopirellula marina TaxID=124 RepID=A0A2S8FPM7_9BACT|nr:Crp/Fnr family transcriptional regulator [Blastopirellula marina]PQO33970.1 Crp/Fnr family transcriptional regulator [Blastopirellula marina]PTL43756.1 Crp/Fnr family transcriptional regulator [Blastopirellula marina]